MITHIPEHEKSVTDQQVFDAFDLNFVGLEPVRSELINKKPAEAKRQLVRYLSNRCNVKYFFDYRHLPLRPIDTDTCPYSFQSSLGLSERLKDFCLFVASRMKDHVYVLPGAGRIEVPLGKNWETMPHFCFPDDLGKRHRSTLNKMVRGQFFESLCVAYHETGDRAFVELFEELLQVFFKTYPLDVINTSADADHFQYSEDRSVMSVGWLILVYISLFYTRIPYEIDAELSFEIIKRIWFLGIQFRRFDTDTYRPYNHHMWERGLVPYFLGLLFPEIPDFRCMKASGAEIIRRHISEDFNEQGGYNEHSIGYWAGAALGEMLYKGIYLSRLNNESLLNTETDPRIRQTLRTLAMICPPGARFPSLGDNGGPLVDPILTLGVYMANEPTCKNLLQIRNGLTDSCFAPSLDYADDKTGFLCARSGYGTADNYLLMSAKTNCGYSGHNHMDLLSLFLTMRGEEIIGEPYTDRMYHSVRMNSAIRGFLYNMSSHNTVLAYGKPIAPDDAYANMWGVLRSNTPITDSWSADSGFYASAYHDGYTFCRHTRELLFHRKKGLIVSDHILRGNRLKEPHIQQWYLMNDTHTTLLGNDALIVEKNKVKLLFVWSGTEHRILIDKPTILSPEMYTSDQLNDRISVSFYTSKAQQNLTVTLNLLILDVTEYDCSQLCSKTISMLCKQLDIACSDLTNQKNLDYFPGIE